MNRFLTKTKQFKKQEETNIFSKCKQTHKEEEPKKTREKTSHNQRQEPQVERNRKLRIRCVVRKGQGFLFREKTHLNFPLPHTKLLFSFCKNN